MLEAYCDESHDECNERVLCIAGYLGTAEAWNCFWGAWDRALAEEGVPEFHMADCEGGQQDFKGKARSERDRLQRRFMDIAIKPDYGLIGFSSAIMLEPYNALLPAIRKHRTIPKGLAVSGSVADPYFLVFQSLVEVMASYPSVVSLPAEERIMFVFDNHHLGGRAGAVYKSILESKTLAYRDRLGDISFDDSARVKPLQAADIIAYENYRYLNECRLDGDTLERPRRARWQFDHLWKGRMAEGRLFGKEQLERLADKAGWE